MTTNPLAATVEVFRRWLDLPDPGDVELAALAQFARDLEAAA